MLWIRRPPLPPPLRQRRPPSPPLKHWRYAGVSPKEKRMTIAAGFVNQDGVLLCADTEQEHGSTKFYSPKIGSFPCAAGMIGFAFAGNSAFSLSAIQKCSDHLKNISNPDDVVQELEKVLDRQYRKMVYAHPGRLSDWNIPYWLLLCFYALGREPSLFVTHETTMRPVLDFECVGIGKDLAHYLVSTTYTTSLSEDNTIRLASYMMNRVKNYVPGCGGPSTFLVIRKNGEVKSVNSQEATQVDEVAEEFDHAARALFFAATDSNLPDSEFEREANAFTSWMMSYRQFWRAQREWIERYAPSLSEQSTPGPPIHGPKVLPPSQE